MGAVTHLDPKELAERWRVSTSTLKDWRYKGSGPAYIKVGRSVFYAVSDVESYEQERKVEPIE